MTKTISTPTTLVEAVVYFSDDERAFQFVKKLRWPDGRVICPRCGHDEHTFISTRRIWRCKGCKKQFSLKVGTIFEDSPLGWDKWLPAVWLLANSKNRVSSHELGRALGVTQKTAWFMFHRIRDAMATRTFQKLSGTIETDETFIGGEAKNMHKSTRKTRVSGKGGVDKGVVQRGGDVRATVVPDLTRRVLQGTVRRWVEKGSSVYSDENKAYKGLDRFFSHKTVNHSSEYVSGDVHTNTIECFWSLLKRSIKGTQVHVSEEHLHRYVDERTFAWNYRKDSDLDRLVWAMGGTAGHRLTWKKLTNHGGIGAWLS